MKQSHPADGLDIVRVILARIAPSPETMTVHRSAEVDHWGHDAGRSEICDKLRVIRAAVRADAERRGILARLPCDTVLVADGLYAVALFGKDTVAEIRRIRGPRPAATPASTTAGGVRGRLARRHHTAGRPS